MAGYSSMGGVWGWYSRLRYGSRPPDIEKGSSSFHSRFAALRSAGREKFDRRLPPQVIVEEPPAPLLPHIQKYPSLVERMGEAGASSLLSRSASQTSRALARPPPIRGSGLPARPDGSWRKEPPDPSTPPLREIPLEIPSPQAISPTSPVPLDTPPGTVPARFDRRQPSGSRRACAGVAHGFDTGLPGIGFSHRAIRDDACSQQSSGGYIPIEESEDGEIG